MAYVRPPPHLGSADKQKWRLLHRALSRAGKRKHPQPISVDVDHLMQIGIQQKWLCALTGRPLEFKAGGQTWGGKVSNPRVCTIDRIDSNQGYVSGNVQLLMWSINQAKGTLSNEEFITVCKSVAYNQLTEK